MSREHSDLRGAMIREILSHHQSCGKQMGCLMPPRKVAVRWLRRAGICMDGAILEIDVLQQFEILAYHFGKNYHKMEVMSQHNHGR